jgi:hypothetical protein
MKSLHLLLSSALLLIPVLRSPALDPHAPGRIPTCSGRVPADVPSARGVPWCRAGWCNLRGGEGGAADEGDGAEEDAMPHELDIPEVPGWKWEPPHLSKRAGPMQMTWGMAAPDGAEWRRKEVYPRFRGRSREDESWDEHEGDSDEVVALEDDNRNDIFMQFLNGPRLPGPPSCCAVSARRTTLTPDSPAQE